MSLVPFYGQARLSATTQSQIRGQGPSLLMSDGVTLVTSTQDLLSVDIRDGVGNIIESLTPVTPSIAVASTLTFNQFTATVLNATRFYDPDGDTFDSVKDGLNTTLLSALDIEWRDADTNAVIPPSDYGNSLAECGTPRSYTLQVSTPSSGLTVNSVYGLPSSTAYNAGTQTYSITTSQYDICYLRPGSMSVLSVRANADGYVGGGYDASVFVPSKGFLPGSPFPSIAFNSAYFQLIMSTAQTDYDYRVEIDGTIMADTSTSLNVGWAGLTDYVTVTTDGQVVFGQAGKPWTLGVNNTAQFTVTATPKPPIISPPVSHTSTLKMWFDSSFGSDLNSTNDAIQKCIDAGGQLPTREQYTNSPYASASRYPNNISAPNITVLENDRFQFFTRGIGSLNAEWGDIPGAYWMGYAIRHTRDPWDSTEFFGVELDSGRVRVHGSITNETTACLL